jgi:hypothetical protein
VVDEVTGWLTYREDALSTSEPTPLDQEILITPTAETVAP